MPFLQIVLNLPLFSGGIRCEDPDFLRPRDSDVSTLQASKTAFRSAAKTKKVRFSMRNLPRYIQLQFELWINIFRRFAG